MLYDVITLPPASKPLLWQQLSMQGSHLHSNNQRFMAIGYVHLGVGARLRVTGKGRKMRSPTLTRETVAVVRAWPKERHGQPDHP